MRGFRFGWNQFEFEVEFSDSNGLGGVCVGRPRPDQQQIWVDGSVSEALKKTAVLHEFLHCVSDLCLLRLSEEQVTRLSVCLPSYLSDAPFTEARAREAVGHVNRRQRLRLGRSVTGIVEALVSLACGAPEVVSWMFLKGPVPENPQM